MAVRSLAFYGEYRGSAQPSLPAKVAILVDSPSRATTFPDFHPPVIAVGRNCESNCNRSRHNHSAQISNEECAYQFISLHFPFSIIEARRHADCLFGRYQSEALSLV